MRMFLLCLILCTADFGKAQSSDKMISVEKFQKKMNRDFNPQQSPLSLKQRRNFTALEFFETDTAYQVVTDFVPVPRESPFEMPATTDRKPVLERA